MSSTANLTLKGKVALVTGAGRGIGAGIARDLGARGASIVVNYRGSASAAETLVQESPTRGLSTLGPSPK
jgi:NAD(P)-dependent dehydrogenase (short-subunit alcohol dehydrogenase family)